MTALLSLDSKNFTLACDGCGQLVTNLAPTMGEWDVAWSLFSQDGWTGDDLATGPHTCGRCTRTSPPRMVEQALTRERTTPATRESRRLTVSQVAGVTVVTLTGNPDLVINARLRDLVLDLHGRVRRLVVDVTRVSRLDSGALDVLVQAHRLSIAVCLVGPAQQIQDALRLLNLDRLFPTCLTLPEALADSQVVDAIPPSEGVPRPDRIDAL
ncbi:STAS domain-containing protein [Dactylosporangium sp. NBC_01737]|uniref:STAS domain-containing protein n=1 Tax=Dactylosporangium sp. NBC_01737 TaxID=2975959 RepID=UPI002E0E23AB|nr:STAS domain-containing protein [Dactylosporangium sp. NBC_01737]